MEFLRKREASSRTCLMVALMILGLSIQGMFVTAKVKSSRYQSGKSNGAGKGKAERPHIVFIMADDLGFNDVGWHARGGSLIRTPYLENLAYNGVRLENYYVQPKCSPTRTSLMTGRYVTKMGMPHINFSPADGLCIPFDQKILPEKLRDLGYATHAVGKWHLGFAKKACLPTNRGFDSFLGILTGTANHYTHRRRSKMVKGFDGNAFYENDTSTSDYAGKFSGHVYAERARDIIMGHDKSQPLFLYAAFEMVHSPMTVPASYRNRYDIKNPKRRILAGQIGLLNEAVRNITVALKRRGLYKNSVIIFTSDNGGTLFQHSSNYPLRGQKASLWEGGIRSVGFVHSPMFPPSNRGMVNRQLMHVTDWLPTLVEGVAGGNLSDLPIALDGFNLWNSIKKNRKSPRKLLLHNLDPTATRGKWDDNDEATWGRREDLPFNPRIQAAIRMGEWKLLTGTQDLPYIGLPVESDEGPLPLDERDWDRAIRLYRVGSDPGERKNVAADNKEKVLKMLRKLRHFQESSPEPIKREVFDIKKTSYFVNDSWVPYLY